MKAIISPAKTLDLDTPYPDGLPLEKPILEKQADVLAQALQDLSAKQIGKLMSISPKLAELNHQRFQGWGEGLKKNASGSLRPAVYMFRGDVYQGLDPYSLSPAQIKKLHRFTYILSGLYGLLKPLSLIRPHRLEMGTPLPNPGGKDLYAFWGKTIADIISGEISQEKKPILVNLASEEYYQAIRDHLPPTLPVIHPVFLDQVKGKYKIVSFYAKRARGLMLRFMTALEKPEALTGFASEGYHFCAETTQDWKGKKFSGHDSALVFLRESNLH